MTKATSSFSNWHEDNYDSLRFGQQDRNPAQRFRDAATKLLYRVGYVPARVRSNGIRAATRLVGAHRAQFEWLYSRPADDESREILVSVLAFRALGYHKVKLPLNTAAYWDGLKRAERLADPTDSVSIPFRGWELCHIDLSTLGWPVQLYGTPRGAYTQFILEQYRCRRDDSLDIAVGPGECVIDAGACWGDTALYFAHRSRPNGMVLCYEFMPDNLNILQRNLALNPDLSRRIRVIERAAWCESNLRLSIQGKGPGTRVQVGGTETDETGPWALTIDDLIQDQRVPKVDFIKMDIEGSELPALRGAAQTIQRDKPNLAISVYHRLTDFYKVPEFLDSLGCGYHHFLRHFTITAEETVLFATVSP